MSQAADKKKSAPKKPAEHPKYIEMIVAAVGALKERKGSSRQAILKYIQANYKVTDGANVHVKLALKRGVASGALVQAKGTGASGSFKLPVAKKVKVAKKPAAKKPAAKKAVAKKSTPKKKAAAKKSTPKKAKKAVKPKSSAKKASAKKAKKPVKKAAAKKPAAKKVVKKVAKKKTAKK